LSKENLTTEEMTNILLFETDFHGHTIWHWAAVRYTPDILQKML